VGEYLNYPPQHPRAPPPGISISVSVLSTPTTTVGWIEVCTSVSTVRCAFERGSRWAGSVLLFGVLAALTSGCGAESGAAASSREGTPGRTAEAQAPQPSAPAGEPSGTPADGQWLRAAGDFSNTRFSPLSQVTTANVSKLKVAWTFSTGTQYGHEAAPLIVGDTLYVVTPFPNILYALDLTKPGAPVRWSFRPKPNASSKGVACCDVVNRGAAYADGLIVYNTLDDRTVAVDAKTGALRWEARLGDINKGETITMAPLIVKDKVYVGNSGGEMGVRGWLTALNLRDGSMAWRAYSTGPDSDVLIGPRYKPFYAQERGRDLGVSSWPPDAWKIGGGTVWGFISYDPALNLIYYGTGNPGPWNPDQRPGDNKWTCGVFARDADTGEAVWFYQVDPHDEHDYDGINENVLLDLPINGQTRKVLVRPERNGYVYVIDRQTGQVLSATPFAYINSSEGVDLQTGRLKVAAGKGTKAGTVTREICPASPGAKDWQPSAWSPRTNLLYIPHNNICMDYEGVEVNYIAGTPYVGANVRMYAGPGGNRGEFTAWDPVAGKARWKLPERFPAWSGALVTAGDVVFYGTMEGWFKALDAKTGTLLWQFKTGSGVIGQPVAYRGPDGHEYIAVLSGVGGWSGAIVSGQLDARDGSAALGFANAMSDLPEHTTKGGMLYVFSLP
jgi:lanthanide-dependent methanol dehydrogenase